MTNVTRYKSCMLQVKECALMQFADIWTSPEKQAEECNKAYDTFPVVLSFLQTVLS